MKRGSTIRCTFQNYNMGGIEYPKTQVTGVVQETDGRSTVTVVFPDEPNELYMFDRSIKDGMWYEVNNAHQAVLIEYVQ